MPPSTVLISGGNSKAARQLITTLLNHPQCPNLRILTRSQGVETLKRQFPLLSTLPHSIIDGNFMDEATLLPSLQGVSIVVYNGPSIDQNETCLASHEVEARHSQDEINPTHYMQDVSLGHVMRTGKLPLGYSELVEQGFIDLRDFAMVLRLIILDPMKHNRATYELVTENKSYLEVALILQEVMGRDVQCEVIPPATYLAMLKEENVIQNEYAEDMVERIMSASSGV
ncbi:hypothetical protein Clacol_007737 [Clathrus columnatus]|uniref:Uncharacterized protein n=1 Tax=Clathrus columnatus TaxID=1419009 RepID=A0AAV5ALB6_9AGAM|nr:hypothetical protein Clacol_007737 [Clathrus columnatus]